MSGSSREPLYPLRWLLGGTLLASMLVLAGLWWALGNSNWSATLAAAAVAVTLLVCLCVGELIRARLRLSLRVFLGYMTLLTILLGLFGNRAYQARDQRQAVQSILRAGGEVRYDIDESFGGGWFRTQSGLIFPDWLLDVLGPDMFGTVSRVSFDNGALSDNDDLSDVDFRDFPRIAISSCLLSDEAIAKLSTLTHLRELYLVEIGIEDEDLVSIARLKNLEQLMVGMNPGITDRGLRQLSGMKKLRFLELTDTGVTGEGLSQLTALENLEALHLARTQIDDDDLELLGNLSSLTQISLDETQVTDAGIEELHALPQLQWVGLHNTNVTPEAVARLKQTIDRRRTGQGNGGE